MTKPTKWVCTQRRLRSAWASAQSDQSLRCPHWVTLCPLLPFERTAKTLIRLGGCPGWSESSLGTHSFCWFWHVAAHIWNCVKHVYQENIKIFLQKYVGMGSVFQLRGYKKLRYMDRVKRLWYLLPMRAEKVQASLRIRAVSPEPSLLAHTSSESRGTFRQKARSLAPLNGWACAVKICHDGMLEDTNSLDGAHMCNTYSCSHKPCESPNSNFRNMRIRSGDPTSKHWLLKHFKIAWTSVVVLSN